MHCHPDKFRVAVQLVNKSYKTSAKVYCDSLQKAVNKNFGLHSKNHFNFIT